MALPDLTTVQWILSGFSALLVGLSKAGFGTGAGILAVPLMAAVLGPAEMLPVMLLVLITGDVLSVAHYLRVHDRRNLYMLVPGLLVGIVLGMVVLDWFLGLPNSRLWMRRMIGGISVTFVALQLWRTVLERRSGLPGSPFRPHAWQGVSLGACAGVTSTLAHAGGPLVALFLLPQKLERRPFVGTLLKYFFVGNMVKLVLYTHKGLMQWNHLALALVLVPAVVLGALLGVRMNRRFSDRVFRFAVYCLASAVGLYLLCAPAGEGRGQQTGAGGARWQDVFEEGLAACSREDFTAAAGRFEDAAACGAPTELARFNTGVCLYGAGQYGEARTCFAQVRATDAMMLRARATINEGNCCYRQGLYGEAQGHYAAALDLCGAYLARAERTGGTAMTAGEVIRRASHNLAVLECRERATRRGRDGPQGGAARRGGTPEAADAPDGATQGAETEPPPGSAGSPQQEAEGHRSVGEVLSDALSRDAGAVLRGNSATTRPAGRNW